MNEELVEKVGKAIMEEGRNFGALAHRVEGKDRLELRLARAAIEAMCEPKDDVNPDAAYWSQMFELANQRAETAENTAVQLREELDELDRKATREILAAVEAKKSNRLRCAECDCGDGECNWMPNSGDTIARLQLKVGNLETQELKLRRKITDLNYMLAAYRSMLGPVGRKVAYLWLERGVQRVHFDWLPGSSEMTGEERAQIILDWDKASRKPMTPGEEAGL